MSQSWLITGGCGFLGSNLTAALLADGIDVTVIDSLARTGSAENLAWLERCAAQPSSGKLVHHKVDTRNQADIDAIFAAQGKSLSAIAHLAGQVAMTTSVAEPRYDFEVNVLGAINVLEGIRKHASGAVVLFSSTNKVYGDLEQVRHVETAKRWTCPDHPHGFDETTPLSFHSPYGCSKGAADQYFLDYHRIYGLKTIVFRHSSIYGGRQYATIDQGWVGWFCAQALRQQHEAERGKVTPFTISGDGKQVRDLLFADDIVTCYRDAYAKADACAGRAFNIGGGPKNSASLLELFDLLGAQLGVTLAFDRLPPRASDQRVFIADVRLASQVYGWRPTVSREEGVRRMLAWVAELSPRA